jgi:tetrapyrrole methylase family protein/MazG family protein
MSFEHLIKIMEEQTHESLKPFLIEEAYELLEAIDENDPKRIKEELGDLLLQIVFHSRIAGEKGQFTIEEVITAVNDKMVSRHPHVFGKDTVRKSEEVLHKWEEMKQKEGKGRKSIMDGVPRELPALLRARRLQQRASSVGFDWEKVEDVFEKLHEELAELSGAMDKKNLHTIEGEIGDILFVLVRIANFVRVNPEEALRKTITKFIHRFRHIERKAKEQGKKVADMNLEEMEVLWQEAKNRHKGSQGG